MKYATIMVPAAAVRRKPRHQSEMINQLLFGESLALLKEKGDLWVKIRSLHDGYEGWLPRNLFQEVSKDNAVGFSKYITNSLVNLVHIRDQDMHIPLASSLPAFNAGKGFIGKVPYELDGSIVERDPRLFSSDMIRKLSFQWLNAPYLWGGRTIFGVDCSGFVQVIFKMLGKDLPRDAWQQAQEGQMVKKLKDAVCGDLAFFDDKEEIVHVGILLGPEQIIHASGRVRIDAIDKKGIVNGDTGLRSHSLRMIRRFV